MPSHAIATRKPNHTDTAVGANAVERDLGKMHASDGAALFFRRAGASLSPYGRRKSLASVYG